METVSCKENDVHQSCHSKAQVSRGKKIMSKKRKTQHKYIGQGKSVINFGILM